MTAAMAMCADEDCPSADFCRRFTWGEAEEWGDFERLPGETRCEAFLAGGADG